ncbi:9592_t:CDS:2, partial [Rhizophagus irregularis]
NAFVHVEWKNKSQEDAYQFLKIHNLLLENLKQDTFAKIKKDKDNNYVALDGYLEHLDAFQIHPAAILKDNMKFIELNLEGNVLIDNERFLLTSQDIINFRNSITKDVLDIDIRNSVEKNIHQIFEVNDDEVIKASTIYYKPKQSNNERLMLVLVTSEQKN